MAKQKRTPEEVYEASLQKVEAVERAKELRHTDDPLVSVSGDIKGGHFVAYPVRYDDSEDYFEIVTFYKDKALGLCVIGPGTIPEFIRSMAYQLASYAYNLGVQVNSGETERTNTGRYNGDSEEGPEYFEEEGDDE